MSSATSSLTGASLSTNPYFEISSSSNGISFLIKNKDQANMIFKIAYNMLKDLCNLEIENEAKIKCIYKRGIDAKVHRTMIISLMKTAVEAYFKSIEMPEEKGKADSTEKKTNQEIPKKSNSLSSREPLQSIDNKKL